MVISNVNFDPCASPNLDARKGGEVDEEVLRKVFTELDYLVAVHRDLTAQVKKRSKCKHKPPCLLDETAKRKLFGGE